MEERQQILLTPEIAREMLDNNYPKNRNIRSNKVHAIAADIRSGRWNPNISKYDTLKFTDDDMLINGQHRCKAVIEADTPVFIWAEYGVPIEDYVGLDGQTPRNAGDFLMDIPNSRNIATLAKVACAIEDGSTTLYNAVNGIMRFLPKHESISVTKFQILEKIEAENDYFQKITNYGQTAARYLGKKRGAISYAIFTIDFVGNGCLLPEFVKECGKSTPSSSAIIASRSYMTQRIMNKSFNATAQWTMGCIFCAYDHFVEDTEIGSFNKVDTYFKKYDALVAKTRNERRKTL